MRQSIVVLDRGTIGPSVVLRRPHIDHTWVEFERTNTADVVARLSDATIAITNKVPIRATDLAELPNLKMVAVAATGYDVIDIDACKRRGVSVSNIRGYATNSVPEHAFALILALKRSLIGYREDTRNGEWLRSGQFCFFSHPISDLAGGTLGIFGEGAIGQAVASIGRAFGMRVLFAAHKGISGLGPLYTPFESVLRESDVVTLHCPLTPQTRNMIAMAEFEAMAKKPIVINTARGGLVNESALLRALDLGLISGFGFDCLVHEPPNSDDPMLASLARPNVIITPHTAWASAEAMQSLWDQLIDQIERWNRNTEFNKVA